MTDEELIARLRGDDTDFWHCEAADRIEALVKRLETAVDVVAESGRLRGQAEARAERLEAALNECGLEMLQSDEAQAFMQSRITAYREALSFYAKWGVESPRHDDLVRDDGGDIARAALKGADHE